MSTLIIISNYIFVSAFGCILSAAFCGMKNNRHNRLIIAGLIALLLSVQLIIYALFSYDMAMKLYPIITHIPLIILLYFITKTSFVWTVTAVLTAYLCCQPRRWIALLVCSFFNDTRLWNSTVELLITLPLLLFFLKTTAFPMQRFSFQPISTRAFFSIIPLVYYVYDYITIVYTDWLYSGVSVAVEFMPFVCCGAFLVFIIWMSDNWEKRQNLERERHRLDMQLSQSMKEIESMRESQKLAATYRHDLHHHFQYILVCLKNEKNEQAEDYIQGICEELDAQKIIQYCENEAVNLILSSYAARAAKDSVSLKINVTLPDKIHIKASELCVLLSNGLENALHACEKQESSEKAFIHIQGYEKNEKIFLQITNSCAEAPSFQNGLPVANKPEHGIGTRSIRMIVEHYGGICEFLVRNHQFILRVSL